MANSNLPIEIHDHFQKANLLHTYVQKSLGEAKNHALETGQELLLAKAAIPHGSWESECERLFDGSLRCAQFYMQFAKNMEALSKAQRCAILFLESTLEGASKAAKDAARGDTPPKPDKPPKPAPEPEPETEYDETESDSPELDDDPFDADFIEKHAPAKSNGKPPKKYDRAFWFKQWMQSVGPLCRLVDKIANELGEKKESWKTVQDHLGVATEEMQEWMGVKK